MKIKIKRLTESAKLPTKGSEHAAGIDLYSDEDVTLYRDEFRFVPTGIALEVENGYFAYISPRSGKATKEGLFLRSSNVVDSDFRGQILLCCYALGVDRLEIKKSERIAQMVILPVPNIELQEVTELSDTVRSEGGFGHTGKL